VERFHRTLKAANICHADQHWTEALPWFFSESAPHSKRIYTHRQLSSCTANHCESPASS
jgi:hypothetical protein